LFARKSKLTLTWEEKGQKLPKGGDRKMGKNGGRPAVEHEKKINQGGGRTK